MLTHIKQALLRWSGLATVFKLQEALPEPKADAYLLKAAQHFQVESHLLTELPQAQEGTVFLCSNHTGAVDILGLYPYLRKAVVNLKIVVNEELMAISVLRPLFIPVKPPSYRFDNKQGQEEIKSHLAAGGNLLLYPAGKVGVREKQSVQDLPWQLGSVPLLRTHAQRLIPVLVDAENKQQNSSNFAAIQERVLGRRGKKDRAPRGLFAKAQNLMRSYRSQALTLCGTEAIDTMLRLIQQILDEEIPGDLIEAGVWRGGMPLLMRAYLQEKNIRNRKVWLADSFCGLPLERARMQHWQDRWASRLLGQVAQLAVSEEQVRSHFREFDLLDSQVIFLKGWFHESLAQIPQGQKFALLRLDGDYYESSKDSLTFLYPKLSPGGYVIIDDYHLPLGCRRAVDEYRLQHLIKAPLQRINQQSVYWQKEQHESL